MIRTIGIRCVLGFAAAMLLAGVASGHAALVKSEPAARSILRISPQWVRAWFDDELDAKRSILTVWNAQGRRVAVGGVDLDDIDRQTMVVKLKPLRPGKYSVKWRAVAADDGFVTQGGFQFTITPKPTH